MDQHQIAEELQRLQESLDDLYGQVRASQSLEDKFNQESIERCKKTAGLPAGERQVLQALEMLSYTEGKITLGDIATSVYLSEAQTWRYLQRLEAKGYVRRIGQRGGWELNTE